MAVSSKTPVELSIEPRNLRFQSSFGESRWWLKGDPIATAVFNALSATFPEGERKFIESVAFFRDMVDQPLRGQIKAFVRQEANHTREHLAFNTHVADAGYETCRIEARTRESADRSRGKPPVVQLAATSALEHFTAVLSHQLLADPSLLDGAPPEIQRLWRWHAVEEIEHKAVAYDTFLAVTKRLGAFRRWRLRVLVMAVVSLQFSRSMIANVADLLEQDGLEPRRMRGRALAYLLGRPGILRRALPHYLSYYLPGFHPWQCKDQELARAADVALGEAAPA